MYIEKIIIENFKCFHGRFTLNLNEGLNILVGDNEAGKTTILEAFHLALTGVMNGRYLKNELSTYLFNIESVSEYIKSLDTEEPLSPPEIIIELIIAGGNLPMFEGNGNSEKKSDCGICFKIAFDEKYQDEYQELIKIGGIKTIPIEYYDIFWSSFARESITARSIPIKSALIDSSSNRYQNGSDVYISRIVRDFLEPEDVVSISQAHRRMKEVFMEEVSIKTINDKIKTATNISDKEVKLSVDFSNRNAWETSLMTYLDDIPFHFIGKGEQCIIKTKLALSHKKTVEANILLLEEPENHLTYSKLNKLVKEIVNNRNGKQVIISTHSSFVANKLDLGNLILLNNKLTLRLNELAIETRKFFQKLTGYDTLRLILCKKAILVEGDSDELVVQKAYMQKNDGKLPIDDGIDIISVGTSFLRFLEIAKKVKKQVVVMTDNDGDIEKLKSKYSLYLDEETSKFIKICFDGIVDTGTLVVDGKPFNYNTLEPKILKANNLGKMNSILGTEYTDIEEMQIYMRANKTECALKIFDTNEDITFPQYILDAIS